MTERMTLGPWTEGSINALLGKSASITSPGLRIQSLSEAFLHTPYRESTLIGDELTPEVFVINLSCVDCFTLLDYIEAMRRSVEFPAFVMNLRQVRYQSGEVVFARRNHFFTDWPQFNSPFIDDVTASIIPGHDRNITKELNHGVHGTALLPGVAVRKREIHLIPARELNSRNLSNLETGDYIGIYSDTPGLDVSHVGIFIRTHNTLTLRHASRIHGKVIDENFIPYVKDEPGIIVLRAKG